MNLHFKKTTLILLFFSFFVAALAQENCGNGADDDGDGFIDCLDSDCKSNTVPGGAHFNTANNGSGGVLPGGLNDNSWTVSTALSGPYTPAVVMSTTPGVYYASPWPDCNWISHSASGVHSGNVDYYYKIEFYLPCYNSCNTSYSDSAAFCLHMDFFADNSVDEIYINGVPQSAFLPGIPASSPYTNIGYSVAGGVSVSLCNGWSPGANVLIIKVSSSPSHAGFLAQNSTSTPASNNLYPTSTQNISICAGNTYTLPSGSVVNNAGSYLDTIFSSAGGCDSISIINITVAPQPLTNINISMCTNDSILFNGINITTAGVYTDTAQGPGCDTIITLNLTVNPLPSVSVSPNVTITQGTSTTLTATGGATYNWNPTIGLNTNSGNTVVASPSNNTTYCVTITNASGCIDSTCVTITVEDASEIFPCSSAGFELKLPNAFSPNGDNINDNFCLPSEQAGMQGWNNCVEKFSIRIYNRLGEKVYESKDPSFCWDGTSRSMHTIKEGPIMDAQVFIYCIEAKYYNQDKKLKMSGNISLLR